jgi:predicted dehydrogenase
MLKKYKVGIVGAGGVTELHFVGYKEHPERLEVVALCDPNPEALHAKADKYGVPQRFTDLDDFIKNSGIDAVIVCTPTTIRKQVLFPLIEAGLPIFVEKPFSETFKEAAEIVEKAKQHGVPVCVNQNFRRHFPFQFIKEKLAENCIGKVTQIIFNNIGFRQDSGWRQQCERNALSVMGIHWVDGFRFILGSDAATIVCQTSSSSAINCVGETDATVQVVFENQAFATYVQSFSSPFRRTDMVVIGETGSLAASYGYVELYRRGDKTPSQSWKHEVSRETAAYEGINNLFHWLESGNEAPNSARDNLKTISMLDGAYISAKEDRIVYLEQGILA